MKSAEQKIAEIRRPPTLANWVRLNARRRDETAKKIVRFVLGKPQFALTQVYRLIADYATMNFSAANVSKAIDGFNNPLVKKLGREIAAVVIDFLDREDIKGIEAFNKMDAPFPIGRGIIISIKPTFVYMKDGKLTPVFVIGWASIPFSDYQKRLFAALVTRAILTQEGFDGSDALALFVPRIKGAKTERYAHPMWISKLPPMTDEELRKQFDCFGNALDDAVPIIFEELARRER